MEIKEKKAKVLQSGISVRSLCIVLFIAVLIVFVCIFRTSINITEKYDDFLKSENAYDVCEKAAYSIMNTSDFLTENCRQYVATGKKKYLDNYFREVNYEHKREKAMINIKSSIGSSAASDVERALNMSAELTRYEYYSMTLRVLSMGEDVNQYPKELQNVELTAEELLMNSEQMQSRAEEILYSDQYIAKSEEVKSHINIYLKSLVEQTQKLTAEAGNRFKKELKILNILSSILMLIIVILFLSLIFLFLKPLSLFDKAVKSGKQVRCKGAAELRNLAATYNRMHSSSDSNQKKNIELKKSSITDPLTGIYNRKGYEEITAKLNKSEQNIAFLLLDIDEFKTINDTYGHPMGDRALCIVANTLSKFFGSNDYIFRLGGDEFAVIMTEAEIEYSDLINDKINLINDELGCYQIFDHTLSISAGVAFSSTGLSKQLYDAADKQLYDSKRAGRHRCSISKNTL